MAADDVLKTLKASPNGLSGEEAARRLQEYGPNELVAEKRISPLEILVSQFKDILIVILMIATAISALIGEIIDAIVILVIIVACAVLGFVQEYRAERALEALKKMLAPTITALRDGKDVEIQSKDIVPGDIILLEAGDKLPADARLIDITNLQVDEAPLTGESIPVVKTLDVLPESTYVADRKNLVFSGTTITYGKGKAAVTSTGMNTEFGKIAKEVSAVEEEKTPLEKRTENIGKWLGILCLAVCLGVGGFGVAREFYFKGTIEMAFILEMLIFGIALAVAAVPEALPAIVTGALAIGMHEMAKRNALIRKMPAVETLGCTTVICADKTGTLTKGEMTARKVYVDGKIIEVSGVGYEPVGELRVAGKPLSVKEGAFPLLMKGSILCSDANIEQVEGRWCLRGDPTECALVVCAEKGGFPRHEVRAQHPRVGEIPFSSERKRMSTIHPTPEGQQIVYMKGAPEIVLERCASINEGGKVEKLTAEKKREILKVNESMANEALRVLGVSYKEIPKTVKAFDESLESELVFLGLIGMIDPPREEAMEAVKVCKEIKMKPIMITGDHKLTAVAIAKEMGIFEEGDMVLTGDELEKMSDEEFERIVDKVSVYARVSPMHKLKIVKAWKGKGQIVAMTGDGVNDAPAIKNADIGIAMGITGTEVTKEASDMVLADDNFATILKAIERGRWIFDNIKKYLTYLLQCNLVEIVVIGGGVLMGLPLPLLPAQILYVNLATDGLPALALGVSPPDPDVMKRPPRDPKESVFTREVKAFLFVVPLIMSPLLFWTFLDSLHLGIEAARTDLFLTFVFFELAIALNCRSLTYSIYKAKPHKFLLLAIAWETGLLSVLINIPFVRDAFNILLPSLHDVAVVAGACVVVVVSLEMIKLVLRRGSPKKP